MTQIPCTNPAHGVAFHIAGTAAAEECRASSGRRSVPQLPTVAMGRASYNLHLSSPNRSRLGTDQEIEAQIAALGGDLVDDPSKPLSRAYFVENIYGQMLDKHIFAEDPYSVTCEEYVGDGDEVEVMYDELGAESEDDVDRIVARMDQLRPLYVGLAHNRFRKRGRGGGHGRFTPLHSDVERRIEWRARMAQVHSGYETLQLEMAWNDGSWQGNR